MPTLAGIQGESLLSPHDVSANLAQGAKDWEIIRQARERGGMSKLYKDMAAAGVPILDSGAPTTPGGQPAAPGMPAGGAAPATGAPSAGAGPAVPGAGPYDLSGGGLNPEYARKLIEVGGAQGVEAVAKLDEYNRKIQLAREVMRKERLQEMGSVAQVLQGMDQGQQNAVIDATLRNPELAPQQRRLFENIKGLSKDERDPILQMVAGRTMSAADQIQNSINALNAQTQSRLAGVAEQKLPIQRAEVMIDAQQERRLLDDLLTEGSRASEGDRIEKASEIASDSNTAMVEIQDTVATIDKIERMVQEVNRIGEEDIEAGVRAPIVTTIARVFGEEAGKSAATILQTADPGDLERVNAMVKDLVITELSKMERPSDLDLAQVLQRVLSVDAATPGALTAALGDMRDVANTRAKYHQEVWNRYIEGDHNGVLRTRSEELAEYQDLQQAQMARNQIMEQRRAVSNDPTLTGSQRTAELDRLDGLLDQLQNTVDGRGYKYYSGNLF